MKALTFVLRKFLSYSSLCSCVFFGPSVSAREWVWESKPTRTHLIELFTSEGCSSCPPAEARFSKLKADSHLWKDFVPVAFHVDYWNNLGWRDRFSSKDWTQRQRIYAATWGDTAVYTPELVLDGREWRGGEIPLASTELRGVLKVSLADEIAQITFKTENSSAESFDVYVAALGFGLNSNVKAGENRGRRLEHDFVVLSLGRKQMQLGGIEIRVPIDALQQKPNEVGAIAVWLTQIGQIVPIQAVGGWLR